MKARFAIYAGSTPNSSPSHTIVVDQEAVDLLKGLTTRYTLRYFNDLFHLVRASENEYGRVFKPYRSRKNEYSVSLAMPAFIPNRFIAATELLDLNADPDLGLSFKMPEAPNNVPLKKAAPVIKITEGLPKNFNVAIKDVRAAWDLLKHAINVANTMNPGSVILGSPPKIVYELD